LALQREIDRAFDNPVARDLGFGGRGVFPPVNVFQDNDGYLVRVEVPGVAPENLHIETNEQTMTISGERAAAPPAENASYHRRERDGGKFSRTLTLPRNLDTQKAQATYRHGVLTVRVPLKEAAKPRQIEVKAA
jgi:HSP20 family protein